MITSPASVTTSPQMASANNFTNTPQSHPGRAASGDHRRPSQTGATSPLAPVPGSPSKERRQGIFDKVAAKLSGSQDRHHRRRSSAASSYSKSGRPSAGPRLSSQDAPASPVAATGEPERHDATINPKSRGPIFGVKITDAPPLALAVSIIGGQRHQLPILVFSLVEAIFRRGESYC